MAVYNHYKRIRQPRPQAERRGAAEVQHSSCSVPPAAARPFWRRRWPSILNVPFAIADATSLTEAGYVGEDVENILLRLIQNADYDIELRAARHHLHRRDRQDRPQEREPVDHARRVRRGRAAGAAEDPGGHRRQRAARRAGASIPHQEFIQIDTTNILFICGGAFDGIEKIVENRIGKKALGFGAEHSRASSERMPTRSS